jgi:hypothetical protein
VTVYDQELKRPWPKLGCSTIEEEEEEEDMAKDGSSVRMYSFS